MFGARHICLTLLWVGLLGEVNASTVVSGALVSYMVLWFASRGRSGHSSYFSKVPHLIGFAIYYLTDLVKSNWVVTRDVLTKEHHMRPGVLAIPLSAKTDLEITLLSNLIAMTPGTMPIDVSDDRKILYVHFMYITDPDSQRRAIKQELERRVLEILR